MQTFTWAERRTRAAVIQGRQLAGLAGADCPRPLCELCADKTIRYVDGKLTRCGCVSGYQCSDCDGKGFTLVYCCSGAGCGCGGDGVTDTCGPCDGTGEKPYGKVGK